MKHLQRSQKLFISLAGLFVLGFLPVFSTQAYDLEYSSTNYDLPIFLEAVKIGEDVSRSTGCLLDGIAVLRPLQIGTQIGLGSAFEASSFLGESIRLYKEGFDLISLNLFEELSSVYDKKVYLSEFLDILDLSLVTLRQADMLIKNKLVFYKERNVLLKERMDVFEEKVMGDFTGLVWNGFMGSLQEGFFPLRTQYLNNRSYMNLYKRLSSSYDKLIEALSIYREEIVVNEQSLIAGIRVVRFEDARLDLIQKEKEWREKTVN